METILTLGYFACCYLIFKIFKIPLNKWTGTTVVLGAIILLSILLGGMAYFHPASKSARTYFITTPIVSNVRGKVIEVVAEANVPVKKGDILLRIDPIPFQGVVDDLSAQLAFSQQRLEDTRKLVKVAGGAKFDIQQYEKEVLSLKGQLKSAQFDLDSCTIRAAGDGFVTQLRTRPGQIAVTLPLMPVMTFVNSDATFFVAGFSQQPMQNIKVGNEAEVIFPGIPGRVFQARVTNILTALAEGELHPNKNMFSLSNQLPEGQIPVILEFEDDLSDFFIPMGSDAVVAIYSHRWHHIQLIRKILLRIESWKYFAKFH